MWRFISDHEYRTGASRIVVRLVHAVTLLLLVLFGLGPLFWMLKGALTSPAEMAADPLALWPQDPRWENFGIALGQLQVGSYLMNTLWVVIGSWAVRSSPW